MAEHTALFSPKWVQHNAARRHEDACFLLNDIADRLLDRLPDINRRFENVAIIGYPAPALQTAFPKADIIPFFEERPDWQTASLPGEISFPQAGAAAQPKGGSYDLILSLTGLHRVNDPVGALIQLNRALKADGLCLISLFAGETLKELRRALLDADIALTGRAYQRIHPFADIRDLGSLLQRAGFALPVADMDRVTVQYRTLDKLLKDLKGMGEGLALSDRPKTTPSHLFQKAESAYPTPDGLYEATFDIAFLTGWHPHESQQKPLAPGSGKVSMAEALKPKPDA